MSSNVGYLSLLSMFEGSFLKSRLGHVADLMRLRSGEEVFLSHPL